MREYNIEGNRLRLESELKEEFYAYKRQILAGIERIKGTRAAGLPMKKVLKQFFVDIRYNGEFDLIEVTEKGIMRRLEEGEREVILGDKGFDDRTKVMEAMFYRLCKVYGIDLS